MQQIILASGSEGRKELFNQYFGQNFSVHVTGVDEDDLSNLSPCQMVEKLAQRKANAIAPHFFNDFVCAFDTTVECQNKILGKPSTNKEAKEMLLFLHQKKQTVWTGYAFVYKEKCKYGVEKSELILSMTEEEIKSYIKNHPVTKFAGAYAIQKQDTNIKILSGSIDTIIGAPMNIVIEFIKAHKD